MNDNMMQNSAPTIPVERSIQAELLLLLGQRPSHGYELIQRLNDTDFKNGEADAATVYRNLRRLDKDGLIKSHWEVGESGPGRRQYELTPLGEESLKLWSQYLAQQKTKLENFLRAYDDYGKSTKRKDGGNKL